MTTVTPGAVEVTKADRLAALNHHGFKEEADLSYWGSGSDMRQVDETAKLLARHRLAAAPQSQAALVEALREYMSQFGQALEAHGIPFSPAQAEADAKAREALSLAGGDV